MQELKEKELFEINGGNDCVHNPVNCIVIPDPLPPRPIPIGGGNWFVFD